MFQPSTAQIHEVREGAECEEWTSTRIYGSMFELYIKISDCERMSMRVRHVQCSDNDVHELSGHSSPILKTHPESELQSTHEKSASSSTSQV